MADEKTTSSQQIRNIQLRRESSAATRVMTHDKDEMKYFLPVSGKRLSCLTFNCTLLSLEIRCTNKTSLFLQDCLGIIPFSLMSAVHSSRRSPFWAEITLRLGSQLCWLVRAIPGRSTAPGEDNCFSSRWGEQLTTWGRSPNPPGSLSERRVSGEDALLGRHFGETKSGAGCGWEGIFPLSGFDMVSLFSLEKLYWIFKGKSLGLSFQHLILLVSSTWYFSCVYLLLPDP